MPPDNAVVRRTPGIARCLRRRPRVEAIVRQARRHGSRKALAGPVAEWFRDRALPLFLRLGAAAQARVHAYRIDWEARAA
ncbi:hypothetical protein [Sorangium cellulosum]|uniref:hypothetical protein n=1 Tax=Sorangium TaxID=39643 RepID=UPI0002D37F77|nr:hypothetical protein [Sorangium cellulosum]